MDKPNEINSTKKLLSLIRNEEPRQPAAPPSVKTPAIKTKHKNRAHIFSNIVPQKKRTVIGIDFGYDSVKIVRMIRYKSNRFQIREYLSFPTDKELLNFHNENRESFKKRLQGICGQAKDLEIWAIIPMQKVETCHLKIPRVAKRNLPNAVRYAFRKERGGRGDDLVIDYEILGDNRSAKDQSKSVMVYATPRHIVSRMTRFFQDIGYPLTGVTIYPFSIQNYIKLNYIKTNDESICCIFIGLNWSRIDIFTSEGILAMSRTVKACMNSMIEELTSHLETENIVGNRPFPLRKPDAVPEPAAEERHREGRDAAEQIFFRMIRKENDCGDSLAGGLRMDHKDVFLVIKPALDRLVWQLERTIEAFHADPIMPRIGKVLVSGEIIGYRNIVDHIENRLDHHVEADDIDPFTFDFVPADFPVPQTSSERSGYVPAVGMALSENFFTPNLLFTTEDQLKYRTAENYSRFITGSFIGLILVLVGCFFFLKMVNNDKRAVVDKLDRELEALLLKDGKRVDQNELEKMVDQIEKESVNAKGFARRFVHIAVFSALEDVTPAHILFQRIRIGERFTGTSIRKEKEGNDRKGVHYLELEGSVTGDSLAYETDLITFAGLLGKTPIFRLPVIKEKRIQKNGEESILTFILTAEIMIGED